MDPTIKARFNEDILSEAQQRFGIKKDKIVLLDGFESFIYEFERDGREYILRIGHSGRRPERLIHGEVDWINYLADGGASVARATLSLHGELVEALDDGHGGHFLAVAFEKAAGQPPWEIGWTQQRYANYGHLLGRIHALSQNYRPSNSAWKRPEWDDPEIMDVVTNLPPGEDGVIKKLEALLATLRRLPRHPSSYGLMHFDAHQGNMFMDENGAITLFDFDDCCYSWYVYDIAILLFYMVMGQEDIQSFMHQFMGNFLRGYSEETRLEADWLAQIPNFLKLREIDLYAVIHRSFDVDNLDDPWCARYMDGRKEKLLAGTPYIDFDFAELAQYLGEE